MPAPPMLMEPERPDDRAGRPLVAPFIQRRQDTERGRCYPWVATCAILSLCVFSHWLKRRGTRTDSSDLMSQDQTKHLRIGHSPDPDDAFMWYPLADLGGEGPKIDTRPYRFEHVLEDIETLNRRAERAELEITALSMHQYAYVADKYLLTSCGSSMGDGYGPMIVAAENFELRRLITPLDTPEPKKRQRPKLAVPGVRTTATLAMLLMMSEELGVKPGADKTVNHYEVPFDQIIARVASGEFDAGLIIHEGQLTYADAGLVCLVDLGQWWKQTRGLPLPLGGNAIRRDLADEAEAITTILYESIRYALDHRQEAVDYAMAYARDMGQELADRFVGMYVNDYTLDYGDIGRAAVERLLADGAEASILPPIDHLDFARPTPT